MGRILFEPACADRSFRVPVIRTLIDLGNGQPVDGEGRREFLVVDASIEDAEAMATLLLTVEQEAELLDHQQLAERLRQFEPRIPSQTLDELGL